MAHTIVIAGKGGTGKTTVAALLVKLIRENRKGSILAVDADPNSNLAETLGTKTEGTIGSIINEIAEHPEKVPTGSPKERFIEYQIQTQICEGKGFDLLSMGRPEGPGCYCYVNNVLRNIVAKLIKDYDYVVIDNEAGFEHLARRTARSADVLLVVSDAMPQGLRAAKRISDLTEELDIRTKRKFLVINRYNQDMEQEKIKDFNLGLEYLGNIPDDENVAKISSNGGSLLGLKDSSLSLIALRNMLDRIA